MWIWIWLGVVILAMILEFVSTEMVALWFALGGIAALVLAACGVPVWVQIVVFAVLSAVLLLSFRKVALKYLLSKDNTKTNSDALVSQQLRLIEGIEGDKPGTVKINGVVWNAKTEKEEDSIPAKSLVEVVKISGNKVIVKKVEETEVKKEPTKTIKEGK